MYEEVTRTMSKQEHSLLTELVANTQPPVTVAGTVKWVLVWTGGIVLCALDSTACSIRSGCFHIIA